MHMSQGDIGLIGLAVMGQNLVLNMCDNGFTVAVFNRTVSKVDDFTNGPAKGFSVIGTHSIEEFVQALKRPRKIMLMVKAGQAVDAFIEKLLPHLEAGDIIIDGGNSLYKDTQRRYEELKEKNILYVGTGISGGEEGARHGPSIMPGGNEKAWEHVKDIFQSIAAKADGEPCCDWVGEGGAGHYVKMVHNGIEYGDMQLICEAYELLRNGAGCSLEELASTFDEWNKGELDSYLIEITSQILKTKNEKGVHQVDEILDVAGQKGTGKWTVINALEMGLPLTLIAEAVFARNLSSFKDERREASNAFQNILSKPSIDKKSFSDQVKKALYASKIMSYAQGFMLFREASKEFKWHLNYGAIALMWRGGCIIRSKFLSDIKEAFDKDPSLQNLLLDDFFKHAILEAQADLREVVSKAALMGVSIPCLSSALAFFDGYRTEKLPANLLQAQRDFFGAHTYERVDKPRGEHFHFDWMGDKKEKSAKTYNA
jgi:6-phosphogluconate dehydrogenase